LKNQNKFIGLSTPSQAENVITKLRAMIIFIEFMRALFKRISVIQNLAYPPYPLSLEGRPA
jgi:hypothetical protein